MTSRDLSALPDEQQAVYRAVEELTAAGESPLVPLTDVQSKLGLSREDLLAFLTPSLLDTYLNYREDKPDSPGWLAIDGGSAV